MDGDWGKEGISMWISEPRFRGRTETLQPVEYPLGVFIEVRESSISFRVDSSDATRRWLNSDSNCSSQFNSH